MIGKFTNVKISAVSAAVPEKISECMDYVDLLGEKRLKRQIKLTGIERRHGVGKGQKTSDLAIVAAKKILEHTGWDAKELSVLILVTQTPDYQLPATAMKIHKVLNCSNSCMAFDVNLGCSGYTSGIQIAASMLQTLGRKAIVLVGEGEEYDEDRVKSQEFIDNLADFLLFGSAVGGIGLELEDNSPIDFMQYTDGTRNLAIFKEWGHMTKMDGNAVFEFTINDVVDTMAEFKKTQGIEEDNIDYYVFHQAQKMILDTIADVCGIPEEKMLTSYRDYGNTSGASIPVTLCANEGIIKEKGFANVLLCGFGVGLASSIIYGRVEGKNILPVTITNEVFKDE